MNTVKDHVPTLAMLIALFLLLAAVVFLTVHSEKIDSPTVIGLVGSISTIVGAIAGRQMTGNPTPPPGGTLATSSVATSPPATSPPDPPKV